VVALADLLGRLPSLVLPAELTGALPVPAAHAVKALEAVSIGMRPAATEQVKRADRVPVRRTAAVRVPEAVVERPHIQARRRRAALLAVPA
jgi:hypothetical protein